MLSQMTRSPFSGVGINQGDRLNSPLLFFFLSFFVCFDRAINPKLLQDPGVSLWHLQPGPTGVPEWLLASLPALHAALWSSPEMSAWQPSPGLATPEAFAWEE